MSRQPNRTEQPKDQMKPAPEPPEERKGPSGALFEKGASVWLYHKDCPGGKVFSGAAANEAVQDGWVDSPAKVKK